MIRPTIFVFGALLAGLIGCSSNRHQIVGFTSDFEQPRREPLQIGEIIEISPLHKDMPPETYRHKIDSAGEISIPLIGKIGIAGLTPDEAAAKVAREFTNRGVIRRVELRVSRIPVDAKGSFTTDRVQ